jgi:hypothetical protein
MKRNSALKSTEFLNDPARSATDHPRGDERYRVAAPSCQDVKAEILNLISRLDRDEYSEAIGAIFHLRLIDNFAQPRLPGEKMIRTRSRCDSDMVISGDSGECDSYLLHRVCKERIEEEEESTIVETARKDVALPQFKIIQAQPEASTLCDSESLWYQLDSAVGRATHDCAPQHDSTIPTAEIVEYVTARRGEASDHVANRLIWRAPIAVDQFVPVLKDELRAV